MRVLLPRLASASLLMSISAAHQVLADDGLAAATARFPPLIIGANTSVTDGSGPFARACPVPGSRVEQRGGPVVAYLGADPTRPDLCRMRIGASEVEGWFGIWLTTWAGADLAHDAFDRLIHGKTGATEAFDVRMAPGYEYHEVLRNEGVEDIRLLNQQYRAIKLSHYREGMNGNIYRSVTTGWKDLASGMMIYVTYQHIAGAPVIEVPLVPTAIVPGR